jgi:hypothetical protein
VVIGISELTMFFSVAAMANNNGYKLLSAQGMATLQTFLRDHGNECIRQFVQVKIVTFFQPTSELTDHHHHHHLPFRY